MSNKFILTLNESSSDNNHDDQKIKESIYRHCEGFIKKDLLFFNNLYLLVLLDDFFNTTYGNQQLNGFDFKKDWHKNIRRFKKQVKKSIDGKEPSIAEKSSEQMLNLLYSKVCACVDKSTQPQDPKAIWYNALSDTIEKQFDEIKTIRNQSKKSSNSTTYSTETLFILDDICWLLGSSITFARKSDRHVTVTHDNPSFRAADICDDKIKILATDKENNAVLDRHSPIIELLSKVAYHQNALEIQQEWQKPIH